MAGNELVPTTGSVGTPVDCVDEPPVAFWAQGIVVRLFGSHPLTLMLASAAIATPPTNPINNTIAM